MLALTALVCGVVVSYGFIYEDARDFAAMADPMRQIHRIGEQPMRAMTVYSRLFDVLVFGVQPWGWHLTSLVLHLVNVGLLLAVAWLLLPPWPAIVAAGVFALHPLQAEAMAYVSARADLLAGCGVLLALLAASSGRTAGALVGVAFAALAKETAVVAWALVCLWAAWTYAPVSLKRWALLSVVGAGVVSVWIWDRIDGLSITLSPVLVGEQLTATGRLLLLIVVPYGFSIEHDWAGLAAIWGPVALVVSGGLTAWALTDGWWGRHWFAFGWLWTLICISPRLVVPLYEGLHQRHTYLWMIGWCLCAGHWFATYHRAGVETSWATRRLN